MMRTTTDAAGFFRLEPAPVGRFFVLVDGRTASQVPPGGYYPFVGKAWETVAGRTNNLANGTGEIYLPFIAAGTLQPTSPIEATKITFAASVLAANPGLTGVSITVPANALSIYNGLAYVADDAAGLQVISFRPIDLAGKPPAITLAANFSLAPAQIEEGKSARVLARVSDDVLVRHVEFYIDDLKVLTDGTFPFEYRFISPLITSEKTSFRIRAKAFDTGGAATWSEELVVQLAKDVVPPRVVQHTPAEGDVIAATGTVTAYFSEPINTSSISSLTFTIKAAGPDGILDTADDVTLSPSGFEYRPSTFSAFMKLSSSLPTGQYRATVHLGIWDLAGNPLATPVTWTFRVAGENNRVIERQSIAAGSLFTLALKADHTLWAWGNNDSGQLGVTLPGGNSFDYRTPLQVNQDHNWFSVAAGGSHSAALKTDGSLWGWGLNDQGQLGDSTQETRRLPIQIGTDRDWAMVAVGYDHTLGIKQNHTLWAWGNNGQGKLGDGSEENRLAPIQIGNAPNWFEIGVGRNHTLGLKLDGTLWSWGGNLYGQLGDGTRDSRAVPTQIGSASDWVHVAAAAAGSFSFGLKADGSLWGWGGNGSSGQLGVYRQPGIVNSVADQSSPVPIGSEKSWELDP